MKAYGESDWFGGSIYSADMYKYKVSKMYCFVCCFRGDMLYKQQESCCIYTRFIIFIQKYDMHCLIYTNYTDNLMCIYIRFIINTYTNMICIKEDYTVIVIHRIQAQTT